jgi:hypothetical protein
VIWFLFAILWPGCWFGGSFEDSMETCVEGSEEYYTRGGGERAAHVEALYDV